MSHSSSKAKILPPLFGNLPFGWNVQKFASIAEFRNGLNFLESDSGHLVKLIGVQHFQERFTISYENLSFVSLASPLRDSDLLRDGDLLFVRSNGNRRLIGRVLLIKDIHEPLSYSGFTIRARIVSTQVLPEFVGLYLKTHLARKQMYVLGGGTNISNISQAILGKLDIPIPSLREQWKICAVIRDQEREIEWTEDLITAKAKVKNGLTQQLLTGKKRFKEFALQQWRQMKLSQFTSYKARVKTKPERPFTALGIRSHGKGTFLKCDFDPSKIEMTELFEVKENDLIVNITFAWEGAIAIVGSNDDGALVSHRFPTYEFNTELALPEFFRHVIGQKWFIEKLGIISPGGAGRNRVLSKKDFGKLEVLMPSVEEQRRIAAVLNACDKEIELLKRQLDALKLQKRGLMQKLLTGQIGVEFAD